MEIRLLGPFEVVVDGRSVPVPRGTIRTVLASLALSAGRPVPLQTLVERLWEDDEAPLHARQSVQTIVWRLRGVLGVDVITTERESYRLDVAPDAVDALRFRRALDEAQGAPAERELLVEACRLWRGEPLTGVESEALRRDVLPALTERYLTGLERRIDLDLAAGAGDQLVAELRALTTEHPLREPLWTRLLRALAASGRDAEALQAYEEIRSQLADQLGTDPSEELRELYRRLLTGEPVEQPSAAAPVAAPAALVPRQLPSDITGFVGRKGQLRALDKLLHTDPGTPGRPVRTVVVHGAGGIGKTALAVRWAHSIAHQFPDGQLHLDLRGYGPAAAVTAHEALGALLRAIGVDRAAIPQDTMERAARWRTAAAGRRLLLLLDNARDAEQVRPLLPGVDAVVVVTSRSQLRGLSSRDGAGSLPVPELSRDEARQLLVGTVGAERVRPEAAAADELVRLCGGSPLGLRIVADLADRRTTYSLAELADDLRVHRLETLADPEDPSVDPRAVFSWSYRNLPEDLAGTFRLLSLHPTSDFGLAAGAALIGRPVPVARQLLERLVAVHLLESAGPGRYRLHDLLREYAAELTAAEDPPELRQAALRRLCDWYVFTAGNANAALKLSMLEISIEPSDPVVAPLEFPDAPQALEWFRSELPTLVPVTRYAADHGYPAHAQQLGWLLNNPCELVHAIDEWTALAEAGHRAARTLDDRARFQAAVILSSAMREMQRWDEAESYGREALEYARRVEPRCEVTALNGLGRICVQRADWRGALGYYQQALGVARDHGSDFVVAHVLNNLGEAEIRAGRCEAGIGHCEEAVAIFRRLGADFGAGLALGTLAEGHAEAGDLERAAAYGDEAMELFRKAADAPSHPATLVPIGRVYAMAGQTEKARAVLRTVVDPHPTGGGPIVDEARELLTALGNARAEP